MAKLIAAAFRTDAKEMTGLQTQHGLSSPAIHHNPDQRGGRLIGLIGAFKLLKAALLIGSGAAALALPPERLATHMQSVVGYVGVAPGRALLGGLIQRLFSLEPKTAHHLAVLALAYAAVFLVEGVGLLSRRRWAEWLTVVVTGSFIPFELYELVIKFGAAKLATLILNVAIVIYLIARRLGERRSRDR